MPRSQLHIVSWEPEGRYCNSKMFSWEPWGRYCHRLCTAIAPFWFSTEHLYTAMTPFWLSNDDITLALRLPSPDSVGGSFPGPATTQKFYQGIDWSSQLAGLQWLTVLTMLIRGIAITLTGDWHSGPWLDALSLFIMLRNSLLTEGKILHISVLWMTVWWLTQIMFQLLNTTVT